MENYDPYWPKTILFVGAGASVRLGLAGTDDIGKGITNFVNEELSLAERVKRAFQIEDKKVINELINLFLFLEDDSNQSNKEVANQLGISEARQKELLEIYDWASLKKLIQRCQGKMMLLPLKTSLI